MFKSSRSKDTTKLQWLQYMSQIFINDRNSVRYEANKHFRNEKEEYLKGRINDLGTW